MLSQIKSLIQLKIGWNNAKAKNSPFICNKFICTASSLSVSPVLPKSNETPGLVKPMPTCPRSSSRPSHRRSFSSPSWPTTLKLQGSDPSYLQPTYFDFLQITWKLKFESQQPFGWFDLRLFLKCGPNPYRCISQAKTTNYQSWFLTNHLKTKIRITTTFGWFYQRSFLKCGPNLVKQYFTGKNATWLLQDSNLHCNDRRRMHRPLDHDNGPS